MNPDDATGKTDHSPNFGLPGALSMCMWSGERVGAVPSAAAWRGVAPLTAAPRCSFLGPRDPQRAGGTKRPFSFTDRLFCAACLRVTRYLRPQLGLLHPRGPLPISQVRPWWFRGPQGLWGPQPQPGTTPGASRGLPLLLRTLASAYSERLRAHCGRGRAKTWLVRPPVGPSPSTCPPFSNPPVESADIVFK